LFHRNIAEHCEDVYSQDAASFTIESGVAAVEFRWRQRPRADPGLAPHNASSRKLRNFLRSHATSHNPNITQTRSHRIADLAHRDDRPDPSLARPGTAHTGGTRPVPVGETSKASRVPGRGRSADRRSLIADR
jgi:hypothetical protein